MRTDGALDACASAYSMIDLKPVGASDAGLIFASWGRHPQNFARLTARVFVEVGDAKRYLSALLSSPANRAFHLVEAGGSVVGTVGPGAASAVAGGQA